MKFENSWVIAGVRGTSIAVQWDNITIYQSQQNTGGSVQLPWTDSPNFQIKDLSKCSFFNTRTKDVKPLFPQNTNRYCLSGNNDTILDFTKKDLIYLNELIATNRAPDTVHAEKNIIAPQEIQQRSVFCPDQTKTTFWPNVTNTQDMCQEADVVAIAKIAEGGQSGTFWYTRNEEVQKATISGGLQLDAAMKEVLSGTKIQELSNDPFDGRQGNLITIGKNKFQVNVALDDKRYYLTPSITFPNNANTITFWPFTKEVTIKFIKIK